MIIVTACPAVPKTFAFTVTPPDLIRIHVDLDDKDLRIINEISALNTIKFDEIVD